MKITKALRYTLIFAVVGFITTFLIVYVQRNILDTYNRNLPFISLGDNIKNRTTKAHLWFEELLAGDKSLNFEKDVLSLLTSSQAILQGAYDGKNTELGSFAQTNDEETRAILKESIIDIEKLTEAAKERWNARAQATPVAATDSTATAGAGNAGSDLDQKFDAGFEEFQQTVERLVIHVGKNVNADTAYLNWLSWVSSLMVFVTFVLLCTLLYRLQSSNDKVMVDNKAMLEQETRRVNTLSQFIEAVSAGNYDIELQTSTAEDNLTNTLINMRNKLKTNAEDDRKRNWTTTGIAQIGDILRASNTSSSDLYDNIIKFVVKYTGSNQGGLFILNEDDEKNHFLELVACYAFERKKYMTRQVQIGDGLVGQCFLEGERIYLLEVPQEYINITSGLGGANPNALLIVPLKVNGTIYGVIELASFRRYEPHEIDLVEKLAETIASTISSVRVNETTRVLLEKTQQQAEEMKSQEEEIRQNMEELEATQEEMRRKQTILEKELQQSQQQAEALKLQEKKLTESQDTLQAIVDNIPRAIFWKDRDLRFMGCNKIFASVAGVQSPADLIGKTDFDMAWSAQADAYRRDDQEVMRKREAKLDIEEVNINSTGEESWVLTSKVPIINTNNEVVAILGMFEDITTRKRKEAEINKKLQEREDALKELTALKHLIETRKV
ncbi:GAF domain-containing protein [Fulvivirgaceae bacterium PWU4]|uniref:GAF domain-containing protein n=1 Tax=Chryseosolibacter histidini TaxID=2782349 RepID=A0AAP2DLP5_9BACT|nr:GAF domain-containing protein [Chryseosolibacter histidini]MBT1698561.1 GAF domain-containing protein [Chryseosolibacter histidini]